MSRKKTKRGRKTRKYKRKTNSQVVNTNPTTSTITLNIKGLNHPIKRKRLLGWIMKQNPTICSLKAFKQKDIDSMKPKGWEKINHIHSKHKKAVINH